MKIAIESTPPIVVFDGVGCRVWKGITEQGVPCTLFIHRIAVRNDESTTRFDRELEEELPPGVEVELPVVLP